MDLTNLQRKPVGWKTLMVYLKKVLALVKVERKIHTELQLLLKRYGVSQMLFQKFKRVTKRFVPGFLM